MKTHSVPSTRTERLMLALYEAQQDLAELARNEKLTLTRLAGWANDARTIASLDGLCRLNDVRAQLLVSRYRTLAAARLFELAKDEAAGELSRKACVDLLKVCLIPLTGGEGAGANEDTSPSAVDESAVRRLLSELGRSAEGVETSDAAAIGPLPTDVSQRCGAD